MSTNRVPLHRLLAIFLALQLLFPGALSTASEKKSDGKKIGAGLNFFSAKEEVAMGRRYSEELNQKLDLVWDPEVTAYIEGLGSRLAENSMRPDLAYHFFVVNTKEVNAFASPEALYT